MPEPYNFTEHVKFKTLVSFICGLFALLCVLIAQSKVLLTRGFYRVHYPELHLPFPSEEWNEAINKILESEIIADVTSDLCALPSTPSHFEPLPAITWHHFDFILAGESGRYAATTTENFYSVTAQMVSNLHILHNADTLKISVSRRKLSSSFGLYSYSREAVNRKGKFRRSSAMNNNIKNSGNNSTSKNYTSKNTSEIENGKHDDEHSNINYILNGDFKVGRIPIKDILSRHSFIPSRCASDPGCSYIQMIYYVPPTGYNHLHIVKSLASLSDELQKSSPRTLITGLTISGKASIIVSNVDSDIINIANNRHINSLLKLSKEHLREVLGLPQVHHNLRKQHHEAVSDLLKGTNESLNSGGIRGSSSRKCNYADNNGLLSRGINPVDILFMRARRLSSLFSSAMAHLSASKEMHLTGYGQIQSSMDALSVDKYNTAMEMLLLCKQMILLPKGPIGSRVKSNADISRSQSNLFCFNSPSAIDNDPGHEVGRNDNDDSNSESDRSNQHTHILNAESRTNSGTGVRVQNDSTVSLKTLHTLVLKANILAHEICSDPNHLPAVYFPVDQKLVMYAPYWMPIIVPLCKGLYNIIIVSRNCDLVMKKID